MRFGFEHENVATIEGCVPFPPTPLPPSALKAVACKRLFVLTYRSFTLKSCIERDLLKFCQQENISRRNATCRLIKSGNLISQINIVQALLLFDGLAVISSANIYTKAITCSQRIISLTPVRAFVDEISSDYIA